LVWVTGKEEGENGNEKRKKEGRRKVI